MSEYSHERINVVLSDPNPRSLTRELRRVTLLFWTQLGKWSVLLALLAAGSVMLNGNSNDLIYEPGFVAVIVVAIAAFPAGIAVALRSTQPPQVQKRALLGSTLLLIGFAVGLNGFVIPLSSRSARTGSNPASVRSTLLTGVRAAERRLEDEIWAFRAAQDIEQRARIRGAQLRALDAAERQLLVDQYQKRDRQFESTMRALRWRIQGLVARNQLVIGLAVLPFLASWLGFLTGRWASLVQPGLQRQLFTWAVGLCAVWSGGYTLITGLVMQQITTGPPYLPALPHFVMLPSLLLGMLTVSWLLIGRRIAQLTFR